MANFPLTLHDRGAAVHELHVSLEKLGIVIPQRERDEQVFGVGTQDALLKTQAKYKLRGTGTFDDATQATLARVVAEVETDQPRVEGRIFLDHGLPARKNGVGVNFGAEIDSPVLANVGRI